MLAAIGTRFSTTSTSPTTGDRLRQIGSVTGQQCLRCHTRHSAAKDRAFKTVRRNQRTATAAAQSVWSAWVIVTIQPFEEATAAVDVRLD
jgi:predicted CXXCH cytochrome family protein